MALRNINSELGIHSFHRTTPAAVDTIIKPSDKPTNFLSTNDIDSGCKLLSESTLSSSRESLELGWVEACERELECLYISTSSRFFVGTLFWLGGLFLKYLTHYYMNHFANILVPLANVNLKPRAPLMKNSYLTHRVDPILLPKN